MAENKNFKPEELNDEQLDEVNGGATIDDIKNGGGGITHDVNGDSINNNSGIPLDTSIHKFQ